MTYKKRGKNFLQKNKKIEILNMTPFGMWLLINAKEYFLNYDHYPWFQKANMKELRNIEISGLGSGIYWPLLDIDVELEALEHPERYPLIANIESVVPVKNSKPKKAA